MLRRPVSWLTSAALIVGTMPAPLHAQSAVPTEGGSFLLAQAAVPAPLPGPDQPVAAIYSAEQLDAMLAPIALYPDVLLMQVLMASAFPLQLVDASRWLQQGGNRNLRGEALQRALEPLYWDPSVKSLVPFPQVIAQMTGNLEWLQDLGTATVQQQADVMDSIQRLRQLAAAAGNLRTNDQCVVRTEDRYIYIEPVQPELIYVPAYNPTVVYGSWAYPAYPPVYLPPPPGYGWGPVVGTALVFGVGIVVTAALWNWSRPRWRDRHIHVDWHRYNTINHNRPRIQHDYWRPHYTNSFQRGGLVNQQGTFVAPRAAGVRPMGGPVAGGPAVGGFGGGGGPGGRPGASGFAPGQQFRDRGAPGTAGNSGIVPPGFQHDRGAPGTAGRSGVSPPGIQGGGPGGGRPDGVGPSGGGSSQFRGAPSGGPGGGPGGPAMGTPGGAPGSTQPFQRPPGAGGPGGGPGSIPGGGAPGGGSPFRAAPGGGGPGGGPGGGGVQQFQPQPGGGQGGGGAPQFRPAPGGGGPGGGGTQQFQRPSGGGGPPGGGGGGGGSREFQRPQGGGGGGQPFRGGSSGYPSPSGGSYSSGASSGGGSAAYRGSPSGGSAAYSGGGGSSHRPVTPSGGSSFSSGGGSPHSGGGGASFRPPPSGGGGSSFSGGGGGSSFRGQPSGGGGSAFQSGGGGRSQQSSGGGGQERRRNNNN